jgi:hypothetical protein
MSWIMENVTLQSVGDQRFYMMISPLRVDLFNQLVAEGKIDRNLPIIVFHSDPSESPKYHRREKQEHERNIEDLLDPFVF